MSNYRFEIVRRLNDRYAWLFVAGEGRKREVLARSARDFRSRAKAEKAIDKMRGAPVEPGVPEPGPFQLPRTSFRVVAGVVPLMLEDFPTEYDSSRLSRAEPSPPAAPVAVAEPPAKPKARAAARKSKPRAKRTRS